MREIKQLEHLHLNAPDAKLILSMLERDVNSPVTSSAGRLFDAVAAIAGLRGKVAFEGQAAMQLEFQTHGVETDDTYEMPLVSRDDSFVADWEPLVMGVLEDLGSETPVSLIAAKFHNALANVIAAAAERMGNERVALSGGCFQNRYLTERSIAKLRKAGFDVYWQQRIPTNDNGIALGQILAGWRELSRKEQ